MGRSVGCAVGRLTLLLGGARSGKSRYALEWASAQGGRVLFVATAQAFDEEMSLRIARHKAERPAHWGTLEAPLHVGAAIESAIEAAHESLESPWEVVVVDCMTLLASNAILALEEGASSDAARDAVLSEVDGLLAAVERSTAHWLIVSNEVGMGIVPATRLGRDYRDALGSANQKLAAAADRVQLFVAGLPWQLK